MLLDLTAKGMTGSQAERVLERASITLNKNMIPFDQKSALQTSGIRLGSAAATTRGLSTDDMKQVAFFVDKVLSSSENEAIIRETKQQVNSMMQDLPLFCMSGRIS